MFVLKWAMAQTFIFACPSSQIPNLFPGMSLKWGLGSDIDLKLGAC